MKSQTVKQLIERFFHSAYPSGVTRRVQIWMIGEDKQSEKEEVLREIWEQLDVDRELSFRDSWKAVSNKAGIRPVPFYRNIRVCRRVAAILLPVMVAVGGYAYFSRQVEMIEVATSNNEQKHFRLPDDSEVWLNSGSTLWYAADFRDSVRRIRLAGEACFRVHPDKSKPFIVETANLEVKALGTEFNVCAYDADSRMVATLNQGKIQVDVGMNTGDRQRYVLVPQEQVVFCKKEQKATVKIVGEEAAGWKEGQLIFRDASLSDIMNVIRRHYDVEINFRSADFPADLYSVKFVNNESLAQVMGVLQEMAGFRCVKSGTKNYNLVRIHESADK